MSQSKMFRAIALLSCLPLSTALLETLRNLDLPTDTTSWDYLHTRDPYFNRTGSYFNGVLKMWKNPYTEDAITKECEKNGDSAQYYHSVAWLGPSLDDGTSASSWNKAVDHNNIQAWLVGIPTEKFSDSFLPTYEPTSGGSTSWMEWSPDFPADIKAQVKKTAESFKMRDFPFSMDTSAYGWEMDSTSVTPEHILDLVGQIGTTTNMNMESYNKYNAEYDAYYNSDYYNSYDSYDSYDYYSSDSTTTSTTSTSSPTSTPSPPTSYAYDLQWYYSPTPSSIQTTNSLLPTLNTNTKSPHHRNNPFASHIYLATCSLPGRLLTGHGAQSLWPTSTSSGPISPQASALNEFYASTGSTKEIKPAQSFHYIRASISYDGKNFTILGTNRYHFNRTASASILSALSDRAPEEWYPNPLDHADDAERDETRFVDVMWQFEGRLDEELSTNKLNVTQRSPSRDFPSGGSRYRWERENEQTVVRKKEEVKVVAGREGDVEAGARSGVAKVVGEGWAVGLGVVAVVFIGWM